MKFELEGEKYTLWTTKQADEKYSKYLRGKYPKCTNCGRSIGLGVSHFWGRSHSATRYDDNNCDILCWLPCHSTWEHEKQGDYMNFMIRKLGQRGYTELERKHNKTVKREHAIMDIQIRILTYESNIQRQNSL